MAGLSFAYGIPGTVGGAVFMNAGAYGSEMKNIVQSVRFYDTDTDTICEIPASDCGFAYRTSAFQHKNGVILGASLALSDDSNGTALAEAKDFMERPPGKSSRLNILPAAVRSSAPMGILPEN